MLGGWSPLGKTQRARCLGESAGSGKRRGRAEAEELSDTAELGAGWGTAVFLPTPPFMASADEE